MEERVILNSINSQPRKDPSIGTRRSLVSLEGSNGDSFVLRHRLLGAKSDEEYSHTFRGIYNFQLSGFRLRARSVVESRIRSVIDIARLRLHFMSNITGMDCSSQPESLQGLHAGQLPLGF
jgi:hypothetical protein